MKILPQVHKQPSYFCCKVDNVSGTILLKHSSGLLSVPIQSLIKTLVSVVDAGEAKPYRFDNWLFFRL